MKGIVSIVEALIVGLAVTLLVTLAFTYFWSMSHAFTPNIHNREIQASLCGHVLTIKNLGDVPETIKAVYGIYYVTGPSAHGMQVVELYKGDVLPPGSAKTYTFDNVYNYVFLKLEDGKSPNIPNACSTSIYFVPPHEIR